MPPVRPSKSGTYLTTDDWEAMKASGYTEQELLKDQPFGPMISSYTRAQAIEDGVLVDVMKAEGSNGPLVREAGLRLHTVMTSGAFHATVLSGVTETPDGDFIFPGGQSFTGRLWDVLMLLVFAIRAANAKGSTNEVHFAVAVDANGDGKLNTVKLWSLCGPGDDAEPVLTIMLEGED